MTDQAFHWLGMTIGVVAGMLLIGAVGADWLKQRFRHRRRCPKCWYDLSHTAGLRCSECGYTAKRESALRRSRRQWRWAAIAIVMAAGARVVGRWPEIQKRGWVAGVPTTLLIASLPWTDVVEGEGRYSSLVRAGASIDARLYFELADRFPESNQVWNDVMWSWQVQWLLRRCIAGDSAHEPLSEEWEAKYGNLLVVGLGSFDETEVQPNWSLRILTQARALVDVELKTRPRWPTGSVVYASPRIRAAYGWDDSRATLTPRTEGVVGFSRFENVESSSDFPGHGELWDDELVSLGAPSIVGAPLAFDVIIERSWIDWDAYRLKFEAGTMTPEEEEDLLYEPNWREVRRYSYVLNTEYGGTSEDVLAPVASATLTDAMQARLRPALYRNERTSRWDLAFPVHELARDLVDSGDVTFAVRMTVCVEGKPVGTARAWWMGHRYTGGQIDTRPWGSYVTIDWEQPIDVEALSDKIWTLHVVSDPEMALRNLESNHYWDGEFVVPLRVER